MTSVAHSLPETGSARLGPIAPRESPTSVALTVTALLATAAGYYLGARLGAAMHYPSSVHSVLWPPNAIVLAALLLMPIRQWWLCLLAVLPAHLAIMVPGVFPWVAILGIFVTNTLQGVLSAALIWRLTRDRDTAGAYTITFIACGVFASPIVFSFADVGVLMQAGLVDNFWRAWNLRFLSNAASTIIIVPPILAAARAWQARRRPTWRRLAEGFAIATGFVLLAVVVMFARPFLSNLLPLMLCSFLPLMLWAAVRFGQGGASCVTLGLVAVTMDSLSDWPVGVDEVSGLLMLQAFFLLVAIPVLYLGALHADLQRNITRRRQAEVESEQQRRELAHLTRVGILGKLSGAMAHELNQPLTSILTNAQAAQRLLHQESPDLAEVDLALDDIVTADKRASDVITRLRAMLKKGEAQFQPLDVNTVINEVLELAHSDLIMRGVTATREFAPNLPQVHGDRIQLQQVLLNLIANACEAMTDNESYARELTITTGLNDNRSVQIGVTDSGSGIVPDMQQRLFEPFVTTKVQGLGLGLAISHSIIASHGGGLRAINNADRGATFFIMLPLRREE